MRNPHLAKHLRGEVEDGQRVVIVFGGEIGPAFHSPALARLPPAYAPISSRPISIRRTSFVPAPMSSSLASRMKRSTGQSFV